MENNKIKMKYHMGIWRELSGYPTHEDVIFELTSYLIRDERPEGTFTMNTFNSFLPDGWEKSRHNEIINDLIADGTFIQEKVRGEKIFFKIKNNTN